MPKIRTSTKMCLTRSLCSDFANKTFFGVGSLEIQGSNPEESLDPRQDLSDIGADFAYKTFFGVGSLLPSPTLDFILSLIKDLELKS